MLRVGGKVSSINPRELSNIPAPELAAHSFWASVVGLALESEMLQDTSWSSSGDDFPESAVLHLKELQLKPKTPVP